MIDIKDIINILKTDSKLKKEFLSLLIESLDLRANDFHPLVFINGKPKIGKNVCIGFFSEINAKNGEVEIGDGCDIASFVSINVADSHEYAIGISHEIKRSSIKLGEKVFIGSHSFIGGDTKIGHHCVIGAGTILINGGEIAPYSLVVGNPAEIKPGYFKEKTGDVTKDFS